MPKITPIKGDQLTLIEAPAIKQRYWLQVQSEGRIYTYNECKKAFTLENWDAQPYASIGRARTARYALRKRIGKEFPDGEVLIYDPIAKVVVDPTPSPPEPKLETLPPPLPFDSPCEVQCGDQVVSGVIVPTESNGSHGRVCLLPDSHSVSVQYGDQFMQLPAKDVQLSTPAITPLQAAYQQRCRQLQHQINGISLSGAVAPKNCSIEPYFVTKKLTNGKKEKFKYFRVKSEGQAIFQNRDGKSTKTLHLGTETSAAYKDWKERIQRRNALRLLHSQLDKAERKVQNLRKF